MAIPGWLEIALIIAVIILIFGGAKARESLAKAGKGLYKAKKEIDDIKKIDIK